MSIRNGIVLFLALSTLALLVGCGSSSPSAQAPPSGGFSNSNLNGTYVFSISGTDINSTTSSFFSMVGTLSADGNGNITGGSVDINDPNIGGVFLAQAVAANKYSITKDGRGTGTLATPEGNFGVDFVLTSNGHGLITRYDRLGSGSGTLDLQGSTAQSSLQSLAFSLSGVDSSLASLLGSVGAVTLDASGNVTTGTQDFNDGGSSAGIADLNLVVPGSSVVLTSSTSGTAVLSTSSILGTLDFDVWVVDSTHLKLIETDASGPVLSGDAFTQQTTIPAGQLAFTLSGQDSSGNALVAGGLATSDGSGNLTSGIEDFNDGGTAASQPTFTGTCTFTAGRCLLALTGFSNGAAQSFQFAAYPSSGGIQLLEVDSFGLMQGAAYVQSATSFAASEGYGLNLSGENSGGEVDDIAEFQAGSPSSSPNLTPGILDENDLGSPLAPVPFSGTYTPDPNADGRGSITVPTINTAAGTLNLEYYVVDSSTILFIDVDSSQVGLGTFQQQSASSVTPGAAQPAVSMIRPVVRAHSAVRRK